MSEYQVVSIKYQEFGMDPIELPEIRKSLLETVETCEDENLLRLLYSIMISHTYELEQWQKDELERRSGADEESIPWEEVKKRIRARYYSSQNGEEAIK